MTVNVYNGGTVVHEVKNIFTDEDGVIYVQRKREYTFDAQKKWAEKVFPNISPENIHPTADGCYLTNANVEHSWIYQVKLGETWTKNRAGYTSAVYAAIITQNA